MTVKESCAWEKLKDVMRTMVINIGWKVIEITRYADCTVRLLVESINEIGIQCTLFTVCDKQCQLVSLYDFVYNSHTLSYFEATSYSVVRHCLTIFTMRTAYVIVI